MKTQEKCENVLFRARMVYIISTRGHTAVAS